MTTEMREKIPAFFVFIPTFLAEFVRKFEIRAAVPSAKVGLLATTLFGKIKAQKINREE